MTFERFLAFSVLFHILVIGAFSVSSRRPPAPSSYEINLVSLGDIGGYAAPKEALKEEAAGPVPEEEPAPPKAEPEPAPPAKMAVEAEKPRAEDIISTKEERLAALYAKERLREKRRLREVIQVRKSPTSGSESGATSQGTKNAQTADPSFLNAYGTAVGLAIRKNWFYTGPGELEALVNVTILRDGTLVFGGFEKKSGNALFEESLVNAIKRTAKVEPPPFELETVMRFSP
jgi:hypothetical protein